MGAAASVLEETIGKERCQELAGDAFSEELWAEHSVGGAISRDQLLALGNNAASGSGSGSESQEQTHAPSENKTSADEHAADSSENKPPPVIVVVDDGSYVGERNELGQKHGQGKFTYENGRVCWSASQTCFLHCDVIHCDDVVSCRVMSRRVIS
jgi:hypothetical protein